MRTRLLASVVLGSTLVSASVSAQAFRRTGDGRERVSDVGERHADTQARRDDNRDLAQIAAIARDWKAAVQRRDRAAERAIDAALGRWLDAEINEDRREVGRDTAEANRSDRERDRSRREATASGRADDRRDLQDDRRDLRDDRRDVRRSIAELNRTIAIAQELKGMQPAFDSGVAQPAAYNHKASLLDELVRLASIELAGDRQETREDRRETREDRNERAEPAGRRRRGQ